MTERLGPSYTRLWTASAVSNLGDGIGVVAWPWLATLITRDPLAVALVAIALRLPWFLVSLPAGVVTDRVDRRLLVIRMDVLRFAILSLLATAIWGLGLPASPDPAFPASNTLFWLLLGSAFAAGCAEVLRDNAAQTLMPAIVPDSRLEAANSRLWSIEVLMNSLIGPPLAGLVIAISIPLAFMANGVGFALAAVLVLTVPGTFRTARSGTSHWRTDLREGVAFLWRNPLLRDLAICLGILNAIIQLKLIGLVLFSQEVLGLSSASFGLLLTGGAVGGIIGGLASEWIIRRVGQGRALRWVLLITLAQLLATGLAPHPAPVWIALMAGEAAGMVWNTITVSLRQRLIPSDLLGRVNSVYRFFGWGMMPLGLILYGLVVRLAEPVLGREAALRAPFLVGAVILVILCLWIWRRLSDSALQKAAFS